MSTHPKTSGFKNPKLILFLFFLVIAGPFLFAYMMLQKAERHQMRTTNHGDLITPPVNISKVGLYNIGDKSAFKSEKLAGKWWLVYASPAKCQQTCHETIYNMRQIRTALGKDATRLERLFVAHPECPQSVCETYLRENYPDMPRVGIAPSEYEILFNQISNSAAREMVGEVYIIDPKGNIMMHYDADMEAKAILSDIKRLLRASKIG
ncbi:MAG: SCO family protein [Proteobacteria bacterium]|nr:SCO family protein [Pseudomonadota bacterium]